MLNNNTSMIYLTLICVCILGSSAFITSSSAQAESLAGNTSSEKSEAELAQELTNPVADIITLPMQFNFNEKIGPRSRGQSYGLSFQPVVPIHLNQEWNIISRTIIPILAQQKVFEDTGRQLGLSNIQQSFFLSPKQPNSNIIWGIGPILYLPTATQRGLGTDQTGAGPTGVLLSINGPWTVGVLANQVWKIMGPLGFGGRPLNFLYLEPFIAYTTEAAWTFTINTESQYDWKSEKWTVPINLMIEKLVMFDQTPISFSVGARYFVTSPQEGPQGWGARAGITVLFSK